MTFFYVKIHEVSEPDTFRLDEKYRKSIQNILTTLELETDAILGTKLAKSYRHGRFESDDSDGTRES